MHDNADYVQWRSRLLLVAVIPLLWLADAIAGRAAERYWDAYERGQQALPAIEDYDCGPGVEDALDVVRGLAGEEQRGESEGV